MILKWRNKTINACYLWILVFFTVILQHVPLFGQQNGQIGFTLLTGYTQTIVEQAVEGVEGAECAPYFFTGVELEYILPFNLSAGLTITYSQIDISSDYSIQAQTEEYSAHCESGTFELSSFRLVLKVSYWKQLGT